MISIGLVVGVQASCKRHSDVAISIGLLTTFNAVGVVTAEAMKRLMQTYLLSLLPARSSKEDFVRALNGHWSVMLLVAFAAATFALVLAGIGLSGVSLFSTSVFESIVTWDWEQYNLDEVKQHVSGVVFGKDDTERQNSSETHIHRSCVTPPPHLVDINIQPSQPVSALLSTIEEGTQAAGGNNQSARSRNLEGSSGTATFAESRARDSSVSGVIDRNRKSTQVCESTADWETSTSESITSGSRITSNSCAITSPTRVASSYMDGVFTMDMDMEKTPQATTLRILKPYDDVNKDFPSSLLVGTPTDNVQNTIKRDHYRNRPASKPTVITETSMIGGEEFSFKKRKIGVINGGQANLWNNLEENSDWSDSSLIDSESIIRESSVFSKDPREMTHAQSNSSSNDIGSPSCCFTIGQVSLEVSSEFTPDGVEELKVRERQNSESDGRISRLSYRDEELVSMRGSDTSQLSVADITSEVNALTKKYGCPPEQCLSPITELSSRDSLEDTAAVTLDGSLNNEGLSSRRVPIVIGLLSPNYRRMQDGPKEAGTASMRTRDSPSFATIAKRKGKRGQKNSMAKDNRNRWNTLVEEDSFGANPKE